MAIQGSQAAKGSQPNQLGTETQAPDLDDRDFDVDTVSEYEEFNLELEIAHSVIQAREAEKRRRRPHFDDLIRGPFVISDNIKDWMREG